MDRVLGGSGGRVIVGVRVVDLLPAIARAGPPTPGLGLGPQVRVVRQSGDAAIHAVRGKCGKGKGETKVLVSEVS